MANKTNKSKVAQTPILENDGNTDAPETVSVVPEQTDSNVEATPAKETIKKSRKKMSLNEFCVIKNLRPEAKAGFKVWLNGEYFHFEKEWEELYDKYMNRTIITRR